MNIIRLILAQPENQGNRETAEKKTKEMINDPWKCEDIQWKEFLK